MDDKMFQNEEQNLNEIIIPNSPLENKIKSI